MNFLKEIEKRILIFDGSKGFLLQQYGLPAGEAPDSFNLSHPEIVFKVHSDYVNAGCDVIQTNTFTANRVILKKHSLADKTYDINRKGTEIAVKATNGKSMVAASIGPTGLLFKPFGELDYATAFNVFSEQVKAVADGGADIINFETFTDIMEMKAALNAAKSVCNLPVICSMAFEENGKTLMGTGPYEAGYILLKAGADLIGANCSFGPAHMLKIIIDMSRTGTYLSVKPNAGLPEVIDGATVYKQCSADFVNETSEFASYNARLIGGCCGTTPEYISKLKAETSIKPFRGKTENRQQICSATKYINVDDNYSLGKFVITDEMDENTLTDEILELSYEESDVIEIVYYGSDEMKLQSFILENHSGFKQPVIFSGTNIKAIKNALEVYPGVAGLRQSIDGARGYILI